MPFIGFYCNDISPSVVINRYDQTTFTTKNLSCLQPFFPVAKEMAESLG
jgi:hypothetical protein